MKQQPGAEVVLEGFAEACTRAARELAKNSHLTWEAGKDGFIHFHCPLPGLRGPHNWDGGPRASAWVAEDKVEAYCSKCVGDKTGDYPDQASYETARSAYTDQVKRAIRWEQDGVVHAGFKTEIIRSHIYFDRDFKHAIRRDKIRFEDGRKEKGNANPWRWRVAPVDPDSWKIAGAYTAMRAEDWLGRVYPEHDKLYDALCWFGIDQFLHTDYQGPMTAATCRFKDIYRVVITEGEKDANSFNALMRAGELDGIFATCLCHPKPTKLASHHLRLIAGHDALIIGDADEPGRQHAENWTALLWGHASSIKLVRDQLQLAGTPDEKDLTDWIVQRIGNPPAGQELEQWIEHAAASKKIAGELLDLLASVAPLIEPLTDPTEWRTGMTLTLKGAPRIDSPHNAVRVWTLHPALKGHVRTNLRSGEVEVIDAPWGGEMVGAHLAALACAGWLERTEKLSLSARMLEEALALDAVAPPYNPLASFLEATWDGTPRIDALLTRYIPLNVERPIAITLARIMIGDLIMKMRGVHHAQRIMLGIGTSYPLNLAKALLGRHGFQHQGRITDKHVEQYARHEAGIVQVTMEPIANRQAALVSVPCIFAAHMLSCQRLLSLPWFVAVGDLPVDLNTLAAVSTRCFLYGVLDIPDLYLLQLEAGQLIAEGVARLPELMAEPVPDKDATLTLDARRAADASRHTLTGILLYATKEVSAVEFGSVQMLTRAPYRSEPLKHIVREQFLQAMRLWMYEAHRDIHAQEAAFNSACRSMGWVKPNNPVAVTLTQRVAGTLHYDIAGKDRVNVPGVLINEARLTELKNMIFPDSELEASKNSHSLDDSQTVHTTVKPADPKGSHTHTEAFYTIGENSTKKAPSRAYVRGTTLNREDATPGWLSGEDAINCAQLILSKPGLVGIDFETYPTAASWHADEAAASAKQGTKGAKRKAALLSAQLAGRAKHRQPCTLQLRHEDGAEVFCRLLEPKRELSAIFAAVADQRPWEPGVTLVSHNAQFETEVLLSCGVAVDIEDTLLAAKALYLEAMPEGVKQPVSFSLAALVGRELNRTRDKSIRERDWRLEANLDAEAVEYGLQDVRDVVELWQGSDGKPGYRQRLIADGLWEGYLIIARAILPTAAINIAGGLILDTVAHTALMGVQQATADQLERELDRICGGWIDKHGSTAQVSDWIIATVLAGEELRATNRMSWFLARLAARTNRACTVWRVTETGHLALTKGGKVRKAEQLQHAFPQISEYLLVHARWTKATKLLNAFGATLRRYQDTDDRVRGQFRVGGTVTLRHSCDDPNLMQQPAEAVYRALWVAPPGRRLVIADYSQIELRLLAIVAQDERLRAVYREGRDVHQETADIAGVSRKDAKGCNFALCYGSGAGGLAENFGFTLEHAQEVMAKVLGAYTGLAAFRDQAPQQARQQRHIEIEPHRRVRFVEGSSPATTAINYPIQGGAASVQMRALRLIYDTLAERPELDSFLAASVHDEFILEAPDDARAHEVATLLEDAMVTGLLEVFDEAKDMGVARLSAATVCGSWAEKL